MATDNVPTYNRYLGNDSATEFSIGFPYLDKADVVVYLRRKGGVEEVLDSSRYSFIAANIISFPVLQSDEILHEGDVLAIQRETKLGSNYSFDNQRRLFPIEVMNADDLSFQQIQELAREVKRAVKSTPTDLITSQELLEQFSLWVKEAEKAAIDSKGYRDESQQYANSSQQAQISAEQAVTEAMGYRDETEALKEEVEKKLSAKKDSSIDTSAWEDSPTYASSGFVKQAAVDLGVDLTNAVVYCILNMADAVSGNYSPVIDTDGNNAVLYAKTAPENNIDVTFFISFVQEL